MADLTIIRLKDDARINIKFSENYIERGERECAISFLVGAAD